MVFVQNSRAQKAAINFLKAMLLPIIVYLLFFISSQGTFGTWATIKNNAVNMIPSILIAWGLSFVFSAGIWDMSAAAVVTFSAIVAGNVAQTASLGLVGLIAVSIFVSLLLSLVTAAVCSLFDVSSMIITLGLMLAYEAMTTFVFGGSGVYMMGDMVLLGQSPYCFIVIGVSLLLFIGLWKYTTVSHHIRALGSNKEISEGIGISFKKVQLKAFMLEGLFLGIAAVIYLSNIGSVSSVLDMSSMSMNFDAMIAMFIGMSLTRYCSLPVGIIIGSFTMKMLSTGLMSIGLKANMQGIFTGVFLIAILAYSTNQGKIFDAREARKRKKIVNARLLTEARVDQMQV